MKSLLKRALFASALAVSALPAIAPFVQAAPPPDVFKDSLGNVYVHGTTANNLGELAAATTSEKLTRRVRAGYCGEIRLATSSTLPSIGDSWTVGASTKLRTGLVSITMREDLPRCSGNAFTPALSTAITTAGGYIDATTSVPRVFLTGFTPGISYDVMFNDVFASQNLRPNECGFFRIPNTERNPVPASLTIGGTSYTVASLTTATPPLCRREGTGYVRYTPDSWN
jgi:hypothetical protein